MIELYVNGELIEGLEDSIALTKGINSIGDLSNRSGEYSNTISLPITATNLKALSHVNSVNGNQANIRKISRYEMFDAGVLISEGNCRVISIKEEISILFFSGNSDWSILIKDKELRDLDVDSLNYSLLPAQVASRRNLTSQMSLPNVWYGDFYDSLRPFDVMDFVPCFYVKYLVDKILSDVGFTTEYAFKDLATQQLYEKIVTIHSRKEWKYDLDGYDFFIELASDNTVYVASAWFGGDKIYKRSDDIDITGCLITGKGWAEFINTGSLKIIRIDVDREIGKTLGGYVTINVLSVSTPGVLRVVNDSSSDVIGELNVTTTGIFTIPLAGGNNDYTSTPYRFFIQISLPLDITYSIVGGQLWSKNVNAKESVQTYSTTDEHVANVQGCLPSLKCGEFLVNIFNILGLVTTTNNFESKVLISSLDMILNNKENAVDWSGKVDLSEPVEILYDFFENYSKNNVFKYKDDDKDLRLFLTRFGEGTIIYNNENAENTNILFESTFSATQRASETTPPLAACESRIYGDLNWKLGYTELTNNNLVTQFGLSAPTQSNEVFFDELRFTERIEKNYELIRRVLDNNMAIRLLFKINRIGFQNVDFLTPIFLDFRTESNGQIRGHFYINEIEQYKVGESDSTYLTLVKID